MKRRSRFQGSRVLLWMILWGQLILFSGQSKQIAMIDIHEHESNQFIIGNTTNLSTEHLEAIRVLGW